MVRVRVRVRVRVGDPNPNLNPNPNPNPNLLLREAVARSRDEREGALHQLPRVLLLVPRVWDRVRVGVTLGLGLPGVIGPGELVALPCAPPVGET